MLRVKSRAGKMDGIPFPLDDALVETPPKIFGEVKYIVEGTVDEKIFKILDNGGAERLHYATILATHIVVGEGTDESTLKEHEELFDAKIVEARWVVLSAKAGKLLETHGFEGHPKKLFSSINFSTSGIEGEDLKTLWGLMTYFGAHFHKTITHQTTHLFANTKKSTKYRVAKKHGIKVVCLDWATDCVKAGTLLEEKKYDPRYLNKIQPSKYQSVSSVVPQQVTITSTETKSTTDTIVVQQTPRGSATLSRTVTQTESSVMAARVQTILQKQEKVQLGGVNNEGIRGPTPQVPQKTLSKQRAVRTSYQHPSMPFQPTKMVTLAQSHHKLQMKSTPSKQQETMKKKCAKQQQQRIPPPPPRKPVVLQSLEHIRKKYQQQQHQPQIQFHQSPPIYLQQKHLQRSGMSAQQAHHRYFSPQSREQTLHHQIHKLQLQQQHQELYNQHQQRFAFAAMNPPTSRGIGFPRQPSIQALPFQPSPNQLLQLGAQRPLAATPTPLFEQQLQLQIIRGIQVHPVLKVTWSEMNAQQKGLFVQKLTQSYYQQQLLNPLGGGLSSQIMSGTGPAGQQHVMGTYGGMLIQPRSFQNLSPVRRSPVPTFQARLPACSTATLGPSPPVAPRPMGAIVRTQQMFAPQAQVTQQGQSPRLDLQPPALIWQGEVPQQEVIPQHPQLHQQMSPDHDEHSQLVAVVEGLPQSPGIQKTPVDNRTGSSTQTPRMQQSSPELHGSSPSSHQVLIAGLQTSLAAQAALTQAEASTSALIEHGSPGGAIMSGVQAASEGNESSSFLEGFLIGCVFWLAQAQTDQAPNWRQCVMHYGGEVAESYNPSKVTHVICQNQKFPEFEQVLRDGKRVVTMHWVMDACLKKIMEPPIYAIHLPLPFDEEHQPLKRQSYSLTGLEGEDRLRVINMLRLLGANYTPFFTKLNKGLVACRTDGEKFVKAREWNTPVVNVQFLNELMLESDASVIEKILDPEYQNYGDEQKQFRFDVNLAPQLMAAWNTPIAIPNDAEEKFKVGKRSLEKAAEDGERAKRLKVEEDQVLQLSYFDDLSPLSNDVDVGGNKENNAGNRAPPIILFSGFSEKFKALATEKVEELGARVTSDAMEASHLVIWEICTPNLYSALCRVKYIVGAAWVRDSCKAKWFVSEGAYAPSITAFEKYHQLAIPDILKKPDRHLLFKGMTFYIMPGVCDPFRSGLELIIAAGGGQVDRSSKFMIEVKRKAEKNPSKYIIITAMEDTDYFKEFFSKTPTKKLSILTPMFIYSSIAEQKVDLERFTMKTSSVNVEREKSD